VIAQRGLMAAAFATAEAWIPLLLTTHRGLSLAMAGWCLTPAAISWFCGSWLSGRDTLVPKRVALTLGPVLFAVGPLVAALTLFDSLPLVVLVLGWGVAGVGMGLTFPVLSVLVLDKSPAEEQGVNSAALQQNESLLAALALAVGGVVFAAFAGAGAAIATAGSGAGVQPASSAGLVACFAISGALAALAGVVSRRV
jgi:MFS family permease